MKKVLVVDDDKAVRRVLAAILAALGYEVITAQNGLDAVDLFYSEGDQIDLVFTDLRMPIMGGYEAVDRIRKLKPAEPVICMSSYSGEFRPAGTIFLSKPFTLEAVQNGIGQALTQARLLRV